VTDEAVQQNFKKIPHIEFPKKCELEYFLKASKNRREEAIIVNVLTKANPVV
jgi:hypothetical protein